MSDWRIPFNSIVILQGMPQEMLTFPQICPTTAAYRIYLRSDDILSYPSFIRSHCVPFETKKDTAIPFAIVILIMFIGIQYPFLETPTQAQRANTYKCALSLTQVIYLTNDIFIDWMSFLTTKSGQWLTRKSISSSRLLHLILVGQITLDLVSSIKKLIQENRLKFMKYKK